MTGLTGMDRASGKALTGDQHLVQSIGDIITTPLGTRLMLRDYGCLLADLIDRPATRANLLLFAMAVALAITRWEPRVTVRRVTFTGDFASGQASAVIEANRTDVAVNALTRLTVPLSRTST
ncbi:GPW/gp25 family protein [Novosphingobium huizhouense]|uniref:GPW/gp25 family protein n=1 Tax=Novosphingobium huizhouense TaxID=2866625 RepID=UPI001CD8959F|nr:GPW/gp25 family protein [Novosphingobium huizhouense]